MTREEAAKILAAKYECMKREISCTDLDCIYRACAECDLCYEQGTSGEQIEALEMAIKALEDPEPCEDAVSRTELLHIFEENCYPVHYDHNSIDVGMTLPGIVEVLNIATSVIPKRKMGKWLDNYQYGYKCSECGAYLEIDCGDVEMNFCPNCSADMRGEQDE